MSLRWPAEFEPHKATWLAWPFAPETWPEQMNQARIALSRMIANLLEHEEVHLLVHDQLMEDQVYQFFNNESHNLNNLTLHQVHYNDSWLRDTFPLFLKKDGKPLLLRKIFNSWGEKFPPWLDDQVLGKRLQWEGLEIMDSSIVLEGGAIETNGEGLLLTTEECLLEPNRNPNFSKDDYESWFAENMGIKEVIWLKNGLEHDHTDGHIDNFARFANATTIVYSGAWYSGEENTKRTHENLEILKTAANKFGLQLVELPDAGVRHLDGRDYPRSYANFYIANQLVILPVFNIPEDHKAISILEGLFPNRKIVPIEADDVIIGGGGFHCLSMYETL